MTTQIGSGYYLGMDKYTPETYKARYMRTRTWIASHVARDLMDSNGRDEIVSDYDEQQIQHAEARDAAGPRAVPVVVAGR